MFRPGQFSVFMSAALFAGFVGSAPALAQFQNPITAAKDAYKKAKEQQQQQSGQRTTQPQTGLKPPGNGSAQQASVPAPASTPGAGSVPDSSCCTAEAMKKIAADSGAVDIVGIKPGMTPQQALAAVKAHNPGLRITQINMRLQHPGVTSFQLVPHEIVACNNCSGTSVQVGAEVIVMEFTPPPNPPLLAVVSRYTNFEPTLSANLVAGLEKKYGTEFPGTSSREWVYDTSGKVVTTPSESARWCASKFNLHLAEGDWAGLAHGGSYPALDRDDGSMDINSFRGFLTDVTSNAQNARLGQNVCMPYTVVESDVFYDNGPNTQLRSVFVRITSGGLVYAAQRSTHDWLQAEADAKVKAAHDAAAQRTGTTF
jgi:hypothetical protein